MHRHACVLFHGPSSRSAAIRCRPCLAVAVCAARRT
jgi:hypothetical protein